MVVRMSVRIVLACISTALLISPSMAEGVTTKMKCKTMQGPMNYSSGGISGLLDSVKGGSMQNGIQEFSGPERDSYIALEKARKELIPYLEAYATATQDAAYAMTKCARQGGSSPNT